MVQVINRTPLIGEALGKGFAEGFSQTLSQRLSEKRMEEKTRNALDSLGDPEEFMNLNFLEQSNKIRSAFAHDPDRGHQILQSLQQDKQMKAKAEMDRVAAEGRAREDERKAKADARAEKTQERLLADEARKEAKYAKELEDEQAAIDYVKEKYGEDVPTGKAAMAMMGAKEKKMFETTLAKGAGEEILAINNEIRERGSAAKKRIPAIKASKTANDKNVSGLGDVGTMLYRLTGNDTFLSKDAAILNTSIKQLLGEVRKDAIGGRAAQQEFFYLLDLLPSLGKSQSANDALFNFLETGFNMDMAEDQARLAYLDEIGGIQNAGPRFESEIREKTELLKDAIWNAYKPALQGGDDLFEQAIKKDPSLKKKQRVVTPDGNIGFIDKSKVKKAKQAGYYIYG